MPGSKTTVVKRVLTPTQQTVSVSVSSGVSPRILELQKKIQDQDYINYAIDRIAVIMSRHIVENKSVTGNTVDFLTQ